MSELVIPFEGLGSSKIFDLSGLNVDDAAGLAIDAVVRVSGLMGVPVGEVMDSMRRTCPIPDQIGNGNG